MSNKTQIIQIILDVLKFAGPGNQDINEVRLKLLFSGVLVYCKELPKIAFDSDSHLCL